MIICAVLLIQVEGLDCETVVACYRHGDGCALLKQLGYAPKTKYKVIEQGFIDHEGNFHNRHDAYQHALSCGQLSATTIEVKRDSTENELFSEDLY